MDAISLLKQDHRTVEELFKKFEALGDRASRQKKGLVDKIIRELSVHAMIEEELLYPSAREESDELDALSLEALEEHHVVKWVLYELSKLTPDDERFDAKVKVVIGLVRHHVEEEENEMFPLLAKQVDRPTLQMLGQALEEAKALAPTRPHPRAPDEPPGNILAGTVAKVMDAGRDFVAGKLRLRSQASARRGRVKAAPKKGQATFRGLPPKK